MRAQLEKLRDRMRADARLYERALKQNPRVYVIAADVNFEVARLLLARADEIDAILNESC